MFNKLKKIFNSKNTKENIFIHIPKCGGSSFVGLLKASVKISKEEKNIATHLIKQVGNTKIFHIDFTNLTRKFSASDIFTSDDKEPYKDKNIFLLSRNPIDRLFSEFNFQYHILDGKNGNTNAAIISKIKKMPHSFEEYIKNSETQNYQCKYLLGRKIADKKPVTLNEYETIIESIKFLNIQCGLTEYFQQFISNFSIVTKIKLKDEFLIRKKTPHHLKQAINERTISRIKSLNKYDFMLYEFIKTRIENNDIIKSKAISYDEFII